LKLPVFRQFLHSQEYLQLNIWHIIVMLKWYEFMSSLILTARNEEKRNWFVEKLDEKAANFLFQVKGKILK